MDKFKAAAIQMDTQDQTDRNLEQAARLIKEAAECGAKLVALPETINYIGYDMAKHAEEIPGGKSYQIFSELAKNYGLWLHCGSIMEKGAEGERPYNCSMLFSPAGELAALYRKIHLFDVTLENGPNVQESRRICPGNRMVTVETKEIGCLGLAICYDIRFGELFRLMALAGAQIFITPADFTEQTGRAHWEVLLRTRAIENGCYVVAPGQVGKKPKYRSYGNSMIIDPWGKVISRAEGSTEIITAEIDLNYLKHVRSQIQTLENRRSDVYCLDERQKHPCNRSVFRLQ